MGAVIDTAVSTNHPPTSAVLVALARTFERFEQTWVMGVGSVGEHAVW